MGQDYHYQDIKEWKDGVPYDQWGHALDVGDVTEDRKQARDLTSPYGALYFACGTGDDFHCFDYAELPDGRVVLHSVINSETGCFIQDAGYEIVSKEEAPYVALGMVDQAIEWLYMDDEGALRHDKSGWNQDEYFFVRAVCQLCGIKPYTRKNANLRTGKDPYKVLRPSPLG